LELIIDRAVIGAGFGFAAGQIDPLGFIAEYALFEDDVG